MAGAIYIYRMSSRFLSDLAGLFFPQRCPGCGADISAGTSPLCIPCFNEMPRTGFASVNANPVEKIFFGRLPLVFAHSEMYFSKAGIVQQLIHQLKYKGNLEIGEFMGTLIGQSLEAGKGMGCCDYLVPLPLHPSKLFKRGYNQAEVICRGISARTGIPILNNVVSRGKFTETQTRKKRMERWLNVDGSFYAKDEPVLYKKKLLLIDDVLTTGATLEACGRSILQIPGVQLAIATLAYASK